MLDNLLKQKNAYFKNLSVDGQQRFVDRLYNFMQDKNFIGREGLVVTDDIRVLISASAIQLTFGLKDYTISHLHTINVFPRAFYSKFFETSFKGLTTQTGVLSLSWNDFKEGYLDDTDKVNLGLHELAHALNIDLDEDGSYDQHFALCFERWKGIAIEDFQNLRDGNNTFLRKYGGSNMHEFFAVCIEHFFERPDEFKKSLPRLYWNLALMLNQDPENSTEDYHFNFDSEEVKDFIPEMSGEIKEELVLRKEPNELNDPRSSSKTFFNDLVRRKGIYIAMTTTFVGLFGGIPLLIMFWSNTVVSLGGIFLLLFTCGGLGLIQWKYVKDHLELEYHQFSMYAFSGFGMCLINFIFIINHLISISTYTKTFDVIASGHGHDGLEVVLSGEGHEPTFERTVSNFISNHYDKIDDAKKITVVVDTGLFGFDIITDCQLN